MASQARYGYLFHGGESDLEIELWMIARHKGDTFDNFMRVRKLLWPDRYRHRWTDLMYRNFIDNDVTVLMGSASAQKTSHAVEYVLINYFARPEQTMVVLSTLNMDKLDIGCWAELQMLWKAARERYPELPGNLVAHKRAIATDNLAEVGSRDFRKGCICRPCFPKGTMVDTLNGPVAIERIKPGDMVINANRFGRVKAVSETVSETLVRITLNDGRSIDCTPEHPILTAEGWKKAVDLEICDRVLSADETLQVLQSAVGSGVSESEVLFSTVPRQGAGNELCSMREDIPTLEKKRDEVLQHSMCWKMGSETASFSPDKSFVQALWEAAGNSNKDKAVLFSALPTTPRFHSMQQVWETVHIKGELTREKVHILQSILFREMERPENLTQEQFPNQGRTAGMEPISTSSTLELPDPNWQPESGRQTPLVQSRHCVSDYKIRRGNRRWGASDSVSSSEGQTEGYGPNWNWVARTEILKQGSDPRFDASKGGYTVHNLEVGGHPSYSVNGVVVHNCYVGGKWVGLGILAGTKQNYLFFVCDELQFMAETFAQSWPHLFSNGHVKIIGSGNPKHDPDDQLSIAAEPKEGWNSMPEPEKTVVWDTKFLGGKCINLVGTDSPNFDVPEGKPAPYPKLINRAFANRIAHDHGPESFEYYRLIKGVMKVAFAHSRVITRQLCREHHALEGVIWKDNNQTKLYGLDPSYGGEDRCVGMPMKFGEDTEGNQILLIMPYRVFPINMRLIEKVSVEDQIANILEEELKTYDIPVENVGYDACGKGTIGAAFGRKFGFSVPQAIDSGAQPTKRPVRADLFVEDENGQRRLKTCAEHYSKFVSEMWFSWRYVIEANQLRGLTEDIMAEGCARVYEVVAGNKIEVEPKSNPKKKEDLKRRLGKSPDLADCCCIGIEMARRLGFAIDRLGAAVNPKDDDDFFEQEAKEWQEELQSHHLIHA